MSSRCDHSKLTDNPWGRKTGCRFPLQFRPGQLPATAIVFLSWVRSPFRATRDQQVWCRCLSLVRCADRGNGVGNIGVLRYLLTPSHASRLTFSVAFCYRMKSHTVAGHPRPTCNALMADGLWSGRREKFFDSMKLSAISLQPELDGTGLADNKE